jgi:hypothetical protein
MTGRREFTTESTEDAERDKGARSIAIDFTNISTHEELPFERICVKAGQFCRLFGFVVVCFLISTPLCFANCGEGADLTANLRDSPASIQNLAKEVQGKVNNDVRAAIVKRFGPPTRDVGSGVSIEQWNIESGVLTYSLGLASFWRSGRKVWVTQTANKALPTLTENTFEMYTKAEPQLKYWIGNVSLKPDLSFEFVDSGQSPDHRTRQSQNFFIKHPAGRFAIQFSAGCSADTILERLPEATVFCNLTFSPADGSPPASYDIIVYPSSRLLAFRTRKRPLTFLLEKGW